MKPTITTISIENSRYRKIYTINGVLHREDGPALIWSDGEVNWYKHGKLHRTYGPAVIYPDGTMFWYKNEVFHREDGPAMVWSDGTGVWYLNGKKINK